MGRLGEQPTGNISWAYAIPNVGGVDQLQQTGGQDSRVPDAMCAKEVTQMKAYVQNMRGEPLMPTNPAKARHLLENGRAEVIQRKPFTIRLKYATGENKQPITLGVDAGYLRIGFSAVTEKEELVSGEVELRTDVSDKLKERKMYRKSRRGGSGTGNRGPKMERRRGGFRRRSDTDLKNTSD